MTAFAIVVVAVATSCGTGDNSTSTAQEEDGTSAMPGEIRVTCGPGGRGFPAEALDGPTGAEEADTPQADGLRRLIEDPEGIGLVPRTGWRLLDSDDNRATFGVESDHGDEGLIVVSLRREGDQWTFFGSTHGCRDLMTVPPDGLSPAVWWPDPEATRNSDDLVLQVLATDLNCASGRPTSDRLRQPTIDVTDDEVVITFTAEPVTGDQDCQGHPPTPYELQLEEPIGERQLLDGAYWPARPPAPSA